MTEYPFKEGDTYFTIENDTVVESCWDDVSEELHTPDKIYFKTELIAKQYLYEIRKTM